MNIADIKNDSVHLMLGDCRDRLQELPDGCADLVITSPPYNMNLRIRNGEYCSRQIVKELSTKYANYDDNMPMHSYFWLNVDVLNECLRVSDLVFYNVQILTGNKPALFRLMGNFHNEIKELIVWDKVNAQPAIGAGVMNSRFELLLVLSKEKARTRCFDNGQFQRGTLENLWQIKRGAKRSKNHGAVFPAELVSTVLDNFARPGSVVLDPFMGTGTTGEVAINKKCKFIGIEIDPDYYAFAMGQVFK